MKYLIKLFREDSARYITAQWIDKKTIKDKEKISKIMKLLQEKLDMDLKIKNKNK